MSQPPSQEPSGNPPAEGAPLGGSSIPPGAGDQAPGDLPPPGPEPGGPSGGVPRGSKVRLLIVLTVLAVVVIGVGIFLVARAGDEGSDDCCAQENPSLDEDSDDEGSENERSQDERSDDLPDAEGSEDEQAYVDAITEMTDHRYDAPGDGAAEAALDFTAEESRCTAEALVDVVGVGRLQEVATPEAIRQDPEHDALEPIELSQEQAGAMYEATTGCFDYRQYYVDVLDATVSLDGLTDPQRDCVNRALTDDVLRDLVVASYAGGGEGSEAEQVLQDAVGPCENAG